MEREFEGLYDKYVSNKGLDEATHRATLLTCLSIATYRVLNDELGDTKLVSDLLTAAQYSWNSLTRSRWIQRSHLLDLEGVVNGLTAASLERQQWTSTVGDVYHTPDHHILFTSQ